MDEKLDKIIKHLEYLEKRLEVVEQRLSIAPPLSPETLMQMKRAAEVLLKNSHATTFLLQKKLGLSYQEAVRLFDVLEKHGLVKTREIVADPIQPFKVGSISKYKAKKFLEENS